MTVGQRIGHVPFLCLYSVNHPDSFGYSAYETNEYRLDTETPKSKNISCNIFIDNGYNFKCFHKCGLENIVFSSEKKD